MDMIGDVKCYHCGHVSGQVEGRKTADRLVFHTFEPRPGYVGKVAKAGTRSAASAAEGRCFWRSCGASLRILWRSRCRTLVRTKSARSVPKRSPRRRPATPTAVQLRG